VCAVDALLLALLSAYAVPGLCASGAQMRKRCDVDQGKINTINASIATLTGTTEPCV
jgi:hypothetical protein